ncbi:MAG: Trx7/PDZ domain-containing (seleno)protein, partial [Pirellulaceae bacterium]|nr:Trx7/PDZ domain-containing (seleno)protein [Pirellulaceae bacterium]
DLSLFQFDWELTFAVFLMNADKTIYGRYGTRSSQQEATRDISLEGFRKSLEAALQIHQRYPALRPSLLAKTGARPTIAVPEEYPTLSRFKATLDYQGAVAKSCMHCHQIHDAQREVLRAAKKPIPDSILYPWPHPNVVGLSLDPKQRATVTRVAPGSAADQAGFRPGDELLRASGQPLLSAADFQWVLHNATEAARIETVVRRGGGVIPLQLTLSDGWRRGDISWRTSTWDLRRMALGGLFLESVSDDDRAAAKIDKTELALRVKHAGMYGAHAVAHRAGFKKGDIIVTFDGRTDAMTESQLLAYVLQKTTPGQQLPVKVSRNGKRIDLKLKMQ